MSIIDDATRLDGAPPQEILAWAVARYYPRLALACSFGGPTGIVALDMMMQIECHVPVYYLDTGLLFEQTHALVAQISARYGITPIAVRPSLSLEEQADQYGPQLWKRDPDRCCALRKIEPQRLFLGRFDAWVSGIRRDQASTRAATPAVQWDPRFLLVKLNPFAHWDERMIWTYIHAHDLPYNALHEAGYPSVGCVPCTRAVRPGEGARAGRWSGFSKVECGLHA